MSRPRIPDRDPIGDMINGTVLTYDDETYVLTTASPDDATDAKTIADGELIVRYGVVFLGKPHLSIVPALIALDYGEFLTGEPAWTFLFKRSNLYPRGDVIGHRNDGEDDMVVIKSLDLEYPVHVLVYADASATKPLAQVTALIAPAPDDLPARLRQHLTRYPTIADWQQTQS